jgi:hypothetical protein
MATFPATPDRRFMAQALPRREPPPKPLPAWARVAAALIALTASIFAVFDERDNDLGSVALLGLAALFLVTAITGAQVLKAKFGGNELEFAERAASALDESQRNRTNAPETAIGGVAKAAVAARMSRNADLLNRARIPGLTTIRSTTRRSSPFSRPGAIVDTACSNSEALRLIEGSKYDVVISDVARDKGPDAEDPERDLAGIKLGEHVSGRLHQHVLLFSSRFNPLTYPGRSDAKRLALARRVDQSTFARTNAPTNSYTSSWTCLSGKIFDSVRFAQFVDDDSRFREPTVVRPAL